MALGDVLDTDSRRQIEAAIAAAEAISGFVFAVDVESGEGSVQERARDLHAALPHPRESVMVLVDPGQRRVEVVTGEVVRRDLSDEAVALAIVTMQSSFSDGEFADGIRRGLGQLADAARAPRILHA